MTLIDLAQTIINFTRSTRSHSEPFRSAGRAGRRWASLVLLAGLAPSVQAAGVDLFANQPPMVGSTNGALRVDLVSKYAQLYFYDGTTNRRCLHLRTFNGRFPGPTLEARPGDTLHVRYINRLPPNAAPADEAGDHDHGGGSPEGTHGLFTCHHDANYNTINLHTHGMNVSPELNSDNVLLEIHPGQWVPVEVRIPGNHPTGLFWYHPHKHGAVTTQLGSGMAGNIILVGPGSLDDIPEIAAAKKLQLVFNEMPLIAVHTSTNGQGQAETHYEVPDDPLFSVILAELTVFTVNGIPVHEIDSNMLGTPLVTPELPEIRMRPGEVQRWQVTHAGLDRFLRITVTDDAGGASLPLHLIAFDAITIPAMTTNDNVFLGAANRAEVLVKAGAAGTYTLRSLGVSSDQPSEEIPLAKVIVSGDPLEMPLPTRLNPPVARLPAIQDSEIVRRRNITFDFIGLHRTLGGPPRFRMSVNDRCFDINRIDHTMLLNTAEEWTLATHQNVAHPFHIHVNWFQVTHINGQRLPIPRWQDTVVIPTNGTVTIRHRFQQFTGKFVFHCHILSHEDEGMMALLEVIDPANLTPLELWRQELYSTPAGEFNAADHADPDGDGIPNLVHYGFGFLPFFRTGLPVAVPVTVGNQRSLGIRFNRRSSADSGVEYVLERTSDFLDWQAVEPQNQLVGPPQDIGGGLETVVVRDQTTANSAFYRVRVARTEYKPLAITPDLPQ